MIDRKARVNQLTQAALHSAAEQMRLNTRGARAGKPDFTHQLRVGARRARVVVRLFQKQMEPQLATSLQDDLRWIFRTLGELRDRDVLLERVEEAALEDGTATASLAQALKEQRDAAAHAARQALRSKRYIKLVRALLALAAEFAQAEGDVPRARKWAKKRLDRRLSSVLALRTAVGGEDDDARHELRKQLKKLRYTAELVRSLWRPKRVKRYLSAMSELQDVLGEVNDAATGSRLLAETAARLGGDASAQAAPLLRAMEGTALSQVEQLTGVFASFVKAAPFWR